MSTLEITENKAATAQQTPTQISGSKAVLEALLSEGVDTVFGYPGGAIMPIYDALYDYTDRLKHILVRHEQGGIHARKVMQELQVVQASSLRQVALEQQT